jgi:hypothetical protein
VAVRRAGSGEMILLSSDGSEGNYYDMITDTNSSISGDVRRQSQRVEWTLNKNRAVRFRASLLRLLRPYGSIVVELPAGQQEWQFVRLEN